MFKVSILFTVCVMLLQRYSSFCRNLSAHPCTHIYKHYTQIHAYMQVSSIHTHLHTCLLNTYSHTDKLSPVNMRRMPERFPV